MSIDSYNSPNTKNVGNAERYSESVVSFFSLFFSVCHSHWVNSECGRNSRKCNIKGGRNLTDHHSLAHTIAHNFTNTDAAAMVFGSK